MKRISCMLIACSLAGCARVKNATDYFAAPKTAEAARNLKSLAVAFDCGLVVTGAALSRDIAGLVRAGDAAIGTTGRVYAVSAAICTALGGAPSAAPAQVK